MPEEIYIATLTNGPFQENCYFVGDPVAKKGFLVDPGSSGREMLSWIEGSGYTLDKIINTHAHIDHAGAVWEIREAASVPFYVHRGESDNLKSMPRVGPLFGWNAARTPEVDHFLEDGQKIAVGGLTVEVLETPGHTSGGCSLLVGGKHLFVGDTVFQGSIGRTDLPGGDYDTIIDSIRRKILPLSDDVILYPGHGPPTPLGRERKHNPFLVNPGGMRAMMG